MDARNEYKWLILVLKDKYSNDVEREALKGRFMMDFPLKGGDVYYVPFDDNPAFCNFLFVREYNPDDDLRDFLDMKRDAFEPYPSHMRITDAEFRKMVDGIGDSRRTDSVKYGDIVTIKNGIYSKLHGIALREGRSGKVDVGLKFCFGTITEQFPKSDLCVTGNIFRHLKVLR